MEFQIMIPARYKRLTGDLALRYPSLWGHPSHHHRWWRALCGHPQCSGALALVTQEWPAEPDVIDPITGERSGRSEWSVMLEAGFVEPKCMPHHWRLSDYAKQSRRHAPRRPRRSIVPTGFAPVTGSAAERLYIHAGGAPEELFPVSDRDDTGHIQSSLQALTTRSTGELHRAGIIIDCPRCSYPSVLCAADIEAAINAARAARGRSNHYIQPDMSVN